MDATTHRSVSLRLVGARGVVDDAVTRVLEARARIVRDGGFVGALIFLFESAADPTFLRYLALSGSGLAGNAFQWSGATFRVSPA